MFALEQQAKELAEKKREYVSAHGQEKQRLSQWIVGRQEYIAKELHENFGPGVITWPVHFAEVFFPENNGPEGFDIVLANPPYGLINKRQNRQMGHVMPPGTTEQLRGNPEYSSVLYGMVNICTPFIRRSFSLLRKGGVFVEIFPLSFACDQSFSRLRRFVFSETKPLSLEIFPERDDQHKRVFASAKMSVCILTSQKETIEGDGRHGLDIVQRRHGLQRAAFLQQRHCQPALPETDKQQRPGREPADFHAGDGQV